MTPARTTYPARPGAAPFLVSALLVAMSAVALDPSPALALAQDGQELQPMTMERALLLPSWGSYELSPDNRRLVFTKEEVDPETWDDVDHVWVHDLETGESFQLTNSAEGESSPRWYSADEVLFYSRRGGEDAENRLWIISLDGGEARPFLDDEEAPRGEFNADWSKIAYTEESERPDAEEWEARREKRDDAYYAEKKLTYDHIWVYDVETGEKTQVTDDDFDDSGPRWSPDGRWIVFTSNRTGTRMGDPDRSDNADVWVVSADGGEPRRLTDNPGPDRGPVWSPDGRHIAYTGSLQENSGASQSDVFVVSLDEGAEPVRLTAELDRSAGGVEWSPDGRSLYFSVSDGLTSTLYRMPATGGEPTAVLPDDEFVYGGAALSDDGTRLLFTGSSLSVPGDVFIANADGSNIRRVLSPTDGMAGFELADAETLSWEGPGGLEIEGILTYPLGYEAGQRHPLILQVHGGPHGRFSRGFGTSAQIWAARGYAVLQANPRGSSGRSLDFSNANVMDWGGNDFQDLMRGVDLVVEMEVADPDNLAIMGGSYGGFMTFWAITQTDRFRAAIGHAAISDWFSFYGQTDIPYLLEFGFGGLPWETKEVFERFSPIEYAENASTPLLITHGEEDRRVPISQSEQYYRTLKKMGHTVEFLRFPREGHGIREPRHRLFLDREQAAWFETHLAPTRATASDDGSEPDEGDGADPDGGGQGAGR